MKRGLVLCLLAAGCLDLGSTSVHHDVDACSAAPLAHERCVTLHLTGEAALATSDVTALDMWVHYTEGSVERNVEVTTPVEKPTPFPIAVGLHLPLNLQGLVDIAIEAKSGPGYFAYQRATAEPSPGVHLDVDVVMQRLGISGCFDGMFSSSHETDLDCGDQCPPCDSGRHCLEGADCKSASCTFNTNTDTDLCN